MSSKRTKRQTKLDKTNSTTKLDKTNSAKSNTKPKTIESKTNELNIYAIVSPCCKAFNMFVDDKRICTQCGKVYPAIDNKVGSELTTSIVYNISETKNNMIISGELIQEFHNKFKRNANDITCMITEMKCPECNSYCRMSRDQEANRLFVCTKCRNVFSA